MGDEEEVPEPKRKVFIQAVSGYIGGNLAKRFAADGFEVLGTLKAPSDPKPLAVTTVVEATPSASVTTLILVSSFSKRPRSKLVKVTG